MGCTSSVSVSSSLPLISSSVRGWIECRRDERGMAIFSATDDLGGAELHLFRIGAVEELSHLRVAQGQVPQALLRNQRAVLNGLDQDFHILHQIDLRNRVERCAR